MAADVAAFGSRHLADVRRDLEAPVHGLIRRDLGVAAACMQSRLAVCGGMVARHEFGQIGTSLYSSRGICSLPTLADAGP